MAGQLVGWVTVTMMIPPAGDRPAGVVSVDLYHDGAAKVRMASVMVAGQELIGEVRYQRDDVMVHATIEHAVHYRTVTEYARTCAINRARRYLNHARRELKAMAAEHPSWKGKL